MTLWIKRGYLNNLTLSEMPQIGFEVSEHRGVVQLPLARRDLIAFMNRLRDTRDGTSIEDYTQYDGESMWQFLPSNISVYFFAILTIVRSLVHLVEEHRPSEMIVEPSTERWGGFWHGAARIVAGHYGISVKFGGADWRGRLQWPSDPWSGWSLRELNRWLERRRFRRRMARMGQATNHITQPNHGKLLFVTLARHWQPDPENGGRYIDVQVSRVIDELRSRGWGAFIGIDCPYTQDLDKVADVFANRVRQPDTDLVWEGFYHEQPTRAEIGGARTHFAHQFRLLSQDSTILRRLNCQGIDIAQICLPVLQHAFVRMLPQNQGMRLAARMTLRRHKPDVILMTYETGPYQRAYILEGRRLGLPVVGLMHGFISSSNSHYMHNEVTAHRLQPPRGFSVPDVTCVWGWALKNTLTEEGAYPAETVHVTGNWQYDYLFAQGWQFKSDEGADSVRESRRLRILLCTSRQSTEQLVRACLDAIARLGDVQLLIKPHPLEGSAGIQGILESAQDARTRLFEGALQDVLLSVDVVVTPPSTVVFEALMLGKDVVLVDSWQSMGFEQVEASGACICVSKPTEVIGAIRRLESDSRHREQIRRAREEFVQGFFFQPDGRSAERVADTVENLSAGGGGASHWSER